MEYPITNKDVDDLLYQLERITDRKAIVHIQSKEGDVYPVFDLYHNKWDDVVTLFYSTSPKKSNLRLCNVDNLINRLLKIDPKLKVYLGNLNSAYPISKFSDFTYLAIKGQVILF